MWWDEFPCIALPSDPEFDRLHEAALRTMERIIRLDSLACQESALHGLGHWHRENSGRVEAIVDGFIAGHGNARPELIRYARAAHSGCVL